MFRDSSKTLQPKRSFRCSRFIVERASVQVVVGLRGVTAPRVVEIRPDTYGHRLPKHLYQIDYVPLECRLAAWRRTTRRLPGNRPTSAAGHRPVPRARWRHATVRPVRRSARSSTCIGLGGENPRSSSTNASVLGFELRVGYAVDGDAPVVRLPGRDPARTHRDILGAGDSDHPNQSGRTARSGDHPDTLLGKRKLGGLRDDAEIAGERQFEPHSEAVAADCSHHRLAATLRRGDVPGKRRNPLRGAVQKSADVAAAREVLSPRRAAR